MTQDTADKAIREKALKIHELLINEYGERDNRQDRDPIATLVNTILSQNTNDHNRDIAYTQLRDRFPTWPEVRDAEEADVAEAIRPAGLAPTKAPRIQSALHAISGDQGKLSLDFLQDMRLKEARNWLLDLNGVGPKTAAIVLLFALDRPAFPVDTHVHRVTQRLGLIPQGTSREKAHDLLEDLLPEEHYFTFHLNIIEHGRTVCKARTPRCEICVLQDLCRYYRGQVSGEDRS
ncbi:MAG: endonuclease III domain-containing protein [Anaerolineae bacterium]